MSQLCLEPEQQSCSPMNEMMCHLHKDERICPRTFEG